MAVSYSDNPSPPLRWWPGVAIVTVQWLAMLGFPALLPDGGVLAIIAGIAGSLLVLLWWLFFSRAPWIERLLAPVAMATVVVVSYRVVHESIANGMMGMMLPIVGIPVLSVVLVAWAVGTSRLPAVWRRSSLVAAAVVACGLFALVRTGGITGDGRSDLHWRWTETPEQRLLAAEETHETPLTPAPVEAAVPRPTSRGSTEEGRGSAVDEPHASAPGGEDRAVPSVAVLDATVVAEWPGFRGRLRDGVVHDVRLATNWSTTPPVALWRHGVGPGWSSFAVYGTLLYTQEQRGEDEVVSAYDIATGEIVWRHGDAARFWESNAGAGPRATPAIDRGRVFTFGATGIVNALDARDGSVIWSRNAASDTDSTIPGWGFAGSPLIVGDEVVVAASGQLAAYDPATGNPRWFRPTAGGGYSSPQLASIDGVEQILLSSGGGISSVAPADGTLLWEHRWPDAAVSIVQPALTPDGDVLIGAVDASASGVGIQRLSIAHGPAGWTVTERWTSNALKPSFNDYVVHKGYAFGFDGGILACVDLTDGARKWKGGRYGHGQLVLLADQDLLLVLSEEGELALVSATPDGFTELARFPAIEGKTWNHPVLVGDTLLVRNGEEMAAFRVSLAN